MSDESDEADEGTERLSLAEKFKRAGVDFHPPKDGKLSDRWLDRSAPKKGVPFGYVIYDRKQTGLGISVAPSGRMAWCLQTRFPGQNSQARRKLGVYPALSLADARLKAASWLALIESGVDPADAAEQKREAEQEARHAKALLNKQTFTAVAEAFIAQRSNRRAETDAKEIRRMLIAELGPRPVHSITPSDLRELFGRLIRHAPFDARNAYGHADQIFKYAVAEGHLAVSPLASVDKKRLFAGKIKPRQRALTNEEVRALWSATEALGAPYAEFFRLLLLTGARLNELAQARWSELDPALRKALRDARAGASVDWRTLPDEIKTLTVPRERFKSDHEHVIQLSADALTIIEQLRRSGGGDFIFTTTAGIKPINGLSKAKGRLDAAMLKCLRADAALRDEGPASVELTHWVCHDLRRTVRTGLAALQVRFEVAETVLGHTLGGLHATYNVHTYGPEQREALELWAARLREITRPPAPTVGMTTDNVVALPKQQRKRAS